MASSIQPETNENVSFDSNQISSDEQLTQIIDSINENTNTDEPPRTAIGAKLVKKLETLGFYLIEIFLHSKILFFLAANNNKTTDNSSSAATNNNESESRRNINKTASMLKYLCNIS